MRRQHHAVRIAVLLVLTLLAIKFWINMRPATKSTINMFKDKEAAPCKMHTCFNYNLCSWELGFRIHIYESALLHPDYRDSIDYYFKVLKHYPRGPESADGSLPCLYVVTVYDGNDNRDPFVTSTNFNHTFHIRESILKKLPFWGEDGRNHLIINLSMKTLGIDKSLGKAMVAQPTFTEDGFRPGFDIIIPTIWLPKIHEGSFCPPINPAKRTYLLSFQGTGGDGNTKIILDRIQSTLNESMTKEILIELDCFITKKNQASVNIMDWAVCGTTIARVFLLEKSTFALILAPVKPYLTTGIFHLRLYEALKSGAIPVIVGGDRVRLPFDEVLDWRRAVLLIPEARVEELIYLLTAINDDDVLEFRQQGRKLWEIYFSSLQGSTHSVLALIRSRLMFPPPPVQPVATRPAFKGSYTPPSSLISFPFINQDTNSTPSASVHRNYPRNFTTSLIQGYKLWNDWGEPFFMYPALPWDPVPTNKETVREIGSINFKAALISEKFTIVINVYKRQTCLHKVLLNLRGLPFLDKVVVVWNDPMKPDRIKWPQLHVPVQVIKPLENYQDNRFQPYNLIETDAVYLQEANLIIKKADIVTAFRVWREHRDRLVGFFPRYHENYTYYKEQSAKTSVISTVAAFFHRYYLWAYWRFLPAALTDHVDAVGRCDDISMNFLVAHLTKKSPIQVPFDETNVKLKCSTHPTSSVTKPSQPYVVRDYCLKYFSKIMGYTPLIYTELVVDLKSAVIERASTMAALANKMLTFSANATSIIGENATPATSGNAASATGGNVTPVIGTIAISATGGNATSVIGTIATSATGGKATSVIGTIATSATGGSATSVSSANATSSTVAYGTSIISANETSTNDTNATSIIDVNPTSSTLANATSATGENVTSVVGTNATSATGGNATSATGGNATSATGEYVTSPTGANATV